MSDRDAVILVEGLTKRYGRVAALDGLELRVGPSEIHGFLGPNGAGKSTTIRILLGLARASGGSARIFGADAWVDAVSIHTRLAAVPGDVTLWPNLSGGETIDLLARLRGADTRRASYRSERERLCAAFQLDPSKKGRSYSKGNRQKVALVAALAVPAELYLLDEPTSGLDPLMEVVFREELLRVRERGAAVLLSSHILSEVEQLCDRVSIIKAGRVVDSGGLADLRHLSRTEISFAATMGESVPQLPGVSLERNGERLAFTIESERVTSVLPALAELGVEGLRIEPPTLESLFLHHYREDADGVR